MTTAFQTHISDIYEATKLITGPLTSVEAFLLTDGSAAEVATFKPALDTEINALSSKTAKSSAELLYLTVVVENTNVNGFPASDLSGLIEITDIVALPASHINGLEPVATGGNLAVAKVTGLNDAVSGLGYATTTSVNTALADYTLTSGLAPVATGGDLAATLVSGLDSAVGNLNYIKIGSVTTALADYTLTSGLEPVATGGNLAASLVSGLDAAVFNLSYVKIDYLHSTLSDYTPTSGLEPVATGGNLAASLVSGLDAAVSGLGYATTTSVNTALADYTLTSGLEPVATGGALANSLVTGLAPVATGGTLAAGLVILEEMATSYITDNRGFQIPAGTNVTMGLMVMDAKFGQLDTVEVIGDDGLRVGHETPNNIFDVASMLQALESKTGYNANMEYPLSPSVANFNSITTHKLRFFSDNTCTVQVGNTIDVTSSKKPLDVLFAYLSCEMLGIPHNGQSISSFAPGIHFKQDDIETCYEPETNYIPDLVPLCHYYLFNEAPVIG